MSDSENIKILIIDDTRPPCVASGYGIVTTTTVFSRLEIVVVNNNAEAILVTSLPHASVHKKQSGTPHSGSNKKVDSAAISNLRTVQCSGVPSEPPVWHWPT